MGRGAIVLTICRICAPAIFSGMASPLLAFSAAGISSIDCPGDLVISPVGRIVGNLGDFLWSWSRHSRELSRLYVRSGPLLLPAIFLFDKAA
jgi:hypothetical protein